MSVEVVAAALPLVRAITADLVRLSREAPHAEARAFGDNDANRTNRTALNGEIAALAQKTSTRRLWDGPFVQLGNSKVEAAFASAAADLALYPHHGQGRGPRCCRRDQTWRISVRDEAVQRG